jgi:uncharacterized LabA/DUF88 family protein/cold shock CspA family protein
MPISLTRIGVFFDGGYFSSASAYYLYHHSRGARIGIQGLKNFVSQRIAIEEQVDPRHCRVVEAHLFAGRISATEARDRENDSLFRERIWDDILVKEDVTSHYMPMGARGEKGIDVALALECFESAIARELDVVVLVTGDADFIPLVRKLNARGIRVMTIGFAFTFHDAGGRERSTSTSRNLLSESTYPVQLSELIEQYANLPEFEQQLVDGLFLRKRAELEEEGVAAKDDTQAPRTSTSQPESKVETPIQPAAPVTRPESPAPIAAFPAITATPTPVRVTAPVRGTPASRESLERLTSVGIAPKFGRPLRAQPEPELDEEPQTTVEEAPLKGERTTGRVTALKEGFGFIESEWGDSTIFFHSSEVVDRKFRDMFVSMRVSYIESDGSRGPVATKIIIED